MCSAPTLPPIRLGPRPQYVPGFVLRPVRFTEPCGEHQDRWGRPKPPAVLAPSPEATLNADAVLQVKVWLVGISPMVWRRVLVPRASRSVSCMA
jgi:hypothetical protein